MTGSTQANSPASTGQDISIVVVLDRSGSMAATREAAISAFNEYLQTINQKYPDVGMTLVQFNEQMETLFSNRPAKDCPPLTFESYLPSGMTALHDTVFKTIRDVQGRVPSGQKVLFCVLTDGYENSSREHSLESVKAAIQEREATGNWTFTYLGANQDAWEVGRAMGIPTGNVANFAATASGTRAAGQAMGQSTVAYLGGGGGQTAGFYGKENIPDPGTKTGTTAAPVVSKQTTIPEPLGRPTWKNDRHE